MNRFLLLLFGSIAGIMSYVSITYLTTEVEDRAFAEATARLSEIEVLTFARALPSGHELSESDLVWTKATTGQQTSNLFVRPRDGIDPRTLLTGYRTSRSVLSNEYVLRDQLNQTSPEGIKELLQPSTSAVTLPLPADAYLVRSFLKPGAEVDIFYIGPDIFSGSGNSNVVKLGHKIKILAVGNQSIGTQTSPTPLQQITSGDSAPEQNHITLEIPNGLEQQYLLALSRGRLIYTLSNVIDETNPYDPQISQNITPQPNTNEVRNRLRLITAGQVSYEER
jgi:Flp pilus assembly protein CpaB